MPGYGADDLEVIISGYRFLFGEKRTFPEMGWAFLIAESGVPWEWMEHWGETRAAQDGWNEFGTNRDGLYTTHPVLVALNIRSCEAGLDDPRFPNPPLTAIPAFDEAVEEVRMRPIINDCNAIYAGTIPGLDVWTPDSQRKDKSL